MTLSSSFTHRLSDTSFVLLIMILSGFCCGQDPCSVVHDYSVSQNGSDTIMCIHPTTNESCGTLDYLVRRIFECARIKILDNQNLTNYLFIQSAFELTFVGEESSQPVIIQCENSSGIFFRSSHRIRLQNLHFIGCSLNVTEFIDKDDITSDLSSVTFSGPGSKDIEITGCIFNSFVGSSLLFVDINGSIPVVITDSIFQNTDTYSIGDVGLHGARSGGVVIRHTMDTVCKYLINNCTFTGNFEVPNNTACPKDNYLESDEHYGYGGALDIKVSSQDLATEILIDNCSFLGNRGLHGGAVCFRGIGQNSISVINFTRSNFILNSACSQGGAIALVCNPNHQPYSNTKNMTVNVHMESCYFFNNSAFWAGGVAVYHKDHNPPGARTRIILTANGSLWEKNNAYTGGFALGLDGSNISNSEITTSLFACNFTSNTNKGYYDNINAIGAVSIGFAEVLISGNTVFEHNFGTSLLVKDFSKANFSGNITFIHNYGINGAAIHLQNSAYILIKSPSYVLFRNNSAIVSGGAIFSKPIYSSKEIPCILKFDELYSPDKTKVIFQNNTISNIYDQSIFIGNPQKCNQTIILEDFSFEPDIGNQVLTIPKEVVITTKPELENGTLKVMLGERFYLHPQVTDEFNHNSTAQVYLAVLPAENKYFSDVPNFTLVGPSSIGLNNFTKNNELFITGSYSAVNSTFIVEFFFDKSSYRYGNTQLNIALIPCKPGYSYSNETKICECVKDSSIIICPSQSITLACMKIGYWYNSDTHRSLPCPGVNCNYSSGCPTSTKNCSVIPGYCSISNSDSVCWNGRGGKLCSQCKENYSFTFAAYMCVPNTLCTTKNTALMVLGVFCYWLLFIAVVLVILVLDLSLGSGFMYGIVYYFSVATLFTDSTVTTPALRSIISLCVAMTQLDPRLFGEFPSSPCFVQQWDNALYHLMFRYVTPVFIISVILFIVWIFRIRCCHCPKRISLAENSPIHAICILILFSYTSLSQTNFRILRPIIIDGKLYVYEAPSIPYLDRTRHLPYALFAVFVEVFITLPICLLLLFAPCLSRCVNFVKLRLKPILDELQACYHPECRWFAGFFFLARQLTYLTNCIALSGQDLPQMNALLQTLCVFILIVHVSFQPYIKKWLNVLDTVLLIDILLLSFHAISAADPMQFSGINRFFHQAIPFTLTLVPACYLFGVLVTLLLRKFFMWLKDVRFFKFFTARKSKTCCKPAQTCTSTSVHIDHNSDSIEDRTFTDSFFRDGGEREPLLAGDDSNYGSKGQGDSRHSTTSSRVSILNRFPPHKDKASTN